MTQAIVFQLPELPDADRPETHWWRVADGAVVETGSGSEWLDIALDDATPGCKRVALAPAAAVGLTLSAAPVAATPRQAAAAARVAAIESSLGPPDSLHAASTAVGDGGDAVMTAVVDADRMVAWLDWMAGLGVDPHHIVPVAALLPVEEDWTEATIGSERLVGRRGTVVPGEPELVTHLVGEAELRSLDQAETRAAIAAAADPPLDLRTGRFARRRRLPIDRVRIRELVILAALIPLIGIAWSLISLAKLEYATTSLNSETVALAEAALGRPVALESAEAELSQQFRDVVDGGLMAPLSAFHEAIQKEQSVSATEISYRPDRTLAATLAAPTLEPINRVLAAIQRDRYRITAVPRQSADGRSMVDVTVRSTP